MSSWEAPPPPRSTAQGQRLRRRHDQAGHAALSIIGAAYYEQSKAMVEDGDKDKRYSQVAVAEYALSKRTQVYCTVDFNKVLDAVTGEVAGRTSKVGAGVGMRHIF